MTFIERGREVYWVYQQVSDLGWVDYDIFVVPPSVYFCLG